jgi:hypothetical protein
MHAAKAVTTLDGAVVGRVAFGVGAGAPGADPAGPVGFVPDGDGAAVPLGEAEPDAGEPGDGEPVEAGGGAAAVPGPPPSPPQPAASVRVAASRSAAGLVRGLGSTWVLPVARPGNGRRKSKYQAAGTIPLISRERYTGCGSWVEL